jgi:hypothetical protein
MLKLKVLGASPLGRFIILECEHLARLVYVVREQDARITRSLAILVFLPKVDVPKVFAGSSLIICPKMKMK